MVCATLHFRLKANQESKELAAEIKETCENWGIPIHLVLQFAVLEYLNNANQLGDINWELFIKILLDLGADPNYAENNFHQVLPQDKWICPLNLIPSTFYFTLYQSHLSEQALALSDLFLEQQKKIQTELKLSEDAVVRIMEKSLAESKSCFLSVSRWQWLEKNYPKEVKKYLEKHSDKFITALAAKRDFTAIDFFRNPSNQYGIDPFNILMPPHQTWPNPTLDYIYSLSSERVKKFINENNKNCVKRFNIDELAKKGEFDKIDSYIDKYGINPFTTLMELHDKMGEHLRIYTNTPVFEYLEKRFLKELTAYFVQHHERFLKLFMQWKDLESLSKLSFYSIDLNQTKEIISLIDDKLSNRDGDIKVNILKLNLFKRLEMHSEENVRKLFRKGLIDAWKFAASHSDVIYHFTFFYDVEWYRYNNVTPGSDLDPYYQARARYVLDYIFRQEYPNAAKSGGLFNTPKKVSYAGKDLIVSAELCSLIELLQQVLTIPGRSANTFGKVYEKAKELSIKSQPDPQEREIYKALASYLGGSTSLATYVQSQFKPRRKGEPMVPVESPSFFRPAESAAAGAGAGVVSDEKKEPVKKAEIVCR